MRSEVPFPGLLGGLYRIIQVKSRPGIQQVLSKESYYLTMATIRITIIGETQSHPTIAVTAHSALLPLGSQRISFLKSHFRNQRRRMGNGQLPCAHQEPQRSSGELSAAREAGSA